MFDSSVFLNITQSAVMICEEKTFWRDKLARAASAKLNYSVLETRLVKAEDLFRAEFATKLLHLIQALIT